MRYLMLIVILLSGCGQDQSPQISVSLSGNSVIWEGNIYEDATLTDIFNTTMNCLSSLEVSKPGSPYVVLTNSSFYCGGTKASGCYVKSSETIYLIKLDTGEIPSADHEIIHWATGLGVEYHDSIYFNQCERY